MLYVALLLSAWLVAMGLLGIVSPERLVALVRRIQTPGGLYAVAALRLLFGAALLLAAPAAQLPGLVRVFGLLSLASGIVTPFVGVERARQWVGWWSERPRTFLRAWAGLALAFGLLLVWALWP